MMAIEALQIECCTFVQFSVSCCIERPRHGVSRPVAHVSLVDGKSVAESYF